MTPTRRTHRGRHAAAATLATTVAALATLTTLAACASAGISRDRYPIPVLRAGTGVPCEYEILKELVIEPRPVSRGMNLLREMAQLGVQNDADAVINYTLFGPENPAEAPTAGGGLVRWEGARGTAVRYTVDCGNG